MGVWGGEAALRGSDEMDETGDGGTEDEGAEEAGAGTMSG